MPHAGGLVPSNGLPEPSTHANFPPKHVQVTGTSVVPQAYVGPHRIPSTTHGLPTVSSIVAGHGLAVLPSTDAVSVALELQPVEAPTAVALDAKATAIPAQRASLKLATL
jgi:hypothetical protein